MDGVYQNIDYGLPNSCSNNRAFRSCCLHLSQFQNYSYYHPCGSQLASTCSLQCCLSPWLVTNCPHLTVSLCLIREIGNRESLRRYLVLPKLLRALKSHLLQKSEKDMLMQLMTLRLRAHQQVNMTKWRIGNNMGKFHGFSQASQSPQLFCFEEH